jgi:hypothetical protein
MDAWLEWIEAEARGARAGRPSGIEQGVTQPEHCVAARGV